MFVKRDHRNFCRQHKSNKHGRRTGDKMERRTRVTVLGEDYHGTFPFTILPKEIVVFDKQIKELKSEVGKIYRTNRVHAALAESVDARLEQNDNEKVKANDMIGGVIRLKDVEIQCMKHLNSQLEIKGKFLKRDITRDSSRRIETIILSFSKMECYGCREREGTYNRTSIVIKDSFVPAWETRMILKSKIKVADVIERIEDLVINNFILDIKIQDIKIEKEVFTSIHYKAIPRDELNLAPVTLMGSLNANSLLTKGFRIINRASCAIFK